MAHINKTYIDIFLLLFFLQQFKWTVKEARPLFKGSGAGSAAADTNGYHDNHDASSDTDQHHHYENGDVYHHSNGDAYHHHHEDDDVINSSADEQNYRGQQQQYGDGEGVVRADEPLEEELPAPQTTRSMLAVFQSMEDVNRPPPTPEHATKVSRQATSPARSMSIRRGASSPSNNTTTSHHYSNGYHSDEQDHHVMQGEEEDGLYRDYDQRGGEFENEPYRGDPDVVREDTENQTEALPEQGTTKNLLAKFQALTAIWTNKQTNTK